MVKMIFPPTNSRASKNRSRTKIKVPWHWSISAVKTKALARRRIYKNRIVIGFLATFVAGVFLLNFSHVLTETNQPPPAVGSQ